MIRNHPRFTGWPLPDPTRCWSRVTSRSPSVPPGRRSRGRATTLTGLSPTLSHQVCRRTLAPHRARARYPPCLPTSRAALRRPALRLAGARLAPPPRTGRAWRASRTEFPDSGHLGVASEARGGVRASPGRPRRALRRLRAPSVRRQRRGSEPSREAGPGAARPAEKRGPTEYAADSDGFKGHRSGTGEAGGWIPAESASEVAG